MLPAMQLVWKTFADFVGSNGLQAFIESGVLLFFWASVAGAIISCIGANPTAAPPTKLRQIVQASNFSYVATVVAGLVLTAATGAIGAAPSPLPPNASVAGQAASPNQASPSSGSTIQSIDTQKQAFQKMCGWSYIGLGIICLVVFVIPSPTTHDLVKTVGLTTLGFAGTIIGGLANKT
jgi:hypothetical protein